MLSLPVHVHVGLALPPSTHTHTHTYIHTTVRTRTLEGADSTQGAKGKCGDQGMCVDFCVCVCMWVDMCAAGSSSSFFSCFLNIYTYTHIYLYTQQAHDLLADLPELTDVRLAGWRVKGAGAVGTTAAGQQHPHHEEDEVLVDNKEASTHPQQGDVVEYKLKAVENGRSKGVGVLLSNNKDRLDANNLPLDKLDLCQVEPLTLDPEGEWSTTTEGGVGAAQGGEGAQTVWKKDELEPRVFIPSSDLKKVAAHDNGRRWRLEEELSEGCGPPEGADEVMEIL